MRNHKVHESEINRLISELEDKSNISDGSHTFGELYHHRAILFAVICNTYKENSWKSWKHEVKELPNAPAYDGHKPEDIDRLFTLIK